MALQSDQKITKAAVGTTPEGFSTVWSTITGVCEMVDQHASLLGWLPDHGACMLEVDGLRGQVQSSVAEAIQDAASASGAATHAMTTMTQFSTPGAGGPLDEMAHLVTNNS